ncbi:MAG: DNRLRE domain-containing protein, partial [Clostridia bacterium]|nr:DNRLRE domain-containing protein [Clostridia bacterium]
MNPNISTAFETLTGREILDMRTENVKHFDLGQGRRQAVIFASPVHFVNAKGAWEEIDNRLIEKTDSKGRRRFETKAGPFRARFFEDADGGSLASLSSGDTEFSWSYPGANISKPAHTKKALRRKFDSELSRRMKVTDRLSDDVTYESLFPGMSVRLTADDLGVKEDIILENKAALRHAVLQLPAEFDYVKNADESVSVLKNGEIRLTIDAPFTYDADKASIPTAVTLSRAESGVLLRYEINESDLENAAFPVTIDPRVSFSGTHSNIDTNCIHNRKPNSSDYSSSYMTTGCSTNSDTGQKYTHMTLLNFNELAAKKASDTILSAQLYMKVSGYSSSYKFVCAYPIKKTWVSEELGINWEDATWNMLNADTDEYISNRIQSFITRTDTANCVFDITDIYNSWYETDSEGKSKNFGVALARPRDYAGYDLTQFYGSKTSVIASRPYVVVDYVSHAGVKNWWTYETLSCGRAGSANIDLFNGNLVVHHADSSTIGSRMPVSVKHIYNSCQSLSDDFGCGLGWRTSLHQVVRQETVANDNYYIWQDGEGTDHFFKKTTSQPYSDSEGMQLKMHLTADGLTITDKGDTVMAFEKIGAEAFPCRLKSVTDPHGNRMELYYHENGKLEKVKDGIDRETAFAYND